MKEVVTTVSGSKRHNCGYFGDALTLLGIPYPQPPGRRCSGSGFTGSPSASSWFSLAFCAVFHVPDPAGSNPHSPQEDAHTGSLFAWSYLCFCLLVGLFGWILTQCLTVHLSGLELVM